MNSNRVDNMGFFLKALEQWGNLPIVITYPLIMWELTKPLRENLAAESEKPKGKEKKTDEAPDNRDEQRYQDWVDYDLQQQNPSDWHDKDYGTYWGNQ